MRLTSHSDQIYADCLAIHNESFKGVEHAPDGLFRTEWFVSEVFVVRAKDSDTVIGFALVSFRNGQPYVWEIAVAAASRHAGVGRALLDEIEIWAKHHAYDEIELTVKTTNPAQKLYFDAGYRVVRFLRRFYLNDGDGLLMRRVL